MTSPTQMMRHLLAQAPRTMSAPTSVQQATTKVALTPAWRVASSRAVLALLHRVRVASLSKVATWSATVFLVKSACMSAGRAGRQAAHTNVAPTLCWQAAHVHRRDALRTHQPGLRTFAQALLTMCAYLAVQMDSLLRARIHAVLMDRFVAALARQMSATQGTYPTWPRLISVRECMADNVPSHAIPGTPLLDCTCVVATVRLMAVRVNQISALMIRYATRKPYVLAALVIPV